jgi:hypothetical protein
MMMLFRCQLVPSIGSCSIVIFPIAIVHMDQVDTVSIKAVVSTTPESCNQKGESSSARHMVDWRHCPCASWRKLSNLYSYSYSKRVTKSNITSPDPTLCIHGRIAMVGPWILWMNRETGRKSFHGPSHDKMGTTKPKAPATWVDSKILKCGCCCQKTGQEK